MEKTSTGLEAARYGGSLVLGAFTGALIGMPLSKVFAGAAAITMPGIYLPLLAAGALIFAAVALGKAGHIKSTAYFAAMGGALGSAFSEHITSAFSEIGSSLNLDG